MNALAESLCVHSAALLIYAKAQASANFLPLGGVAVGVFQRAYLKHIRIVPTLSQSGVGENEPCRLLETQQPLLVLQNKVVCGNIVRELAATFKLAVNTAPRFLVNAEIALVNRFRVGAGGFQIALIGRVLNGKIIIQHAEVFFLENNAVFAQHFLAVFVIAAVLCHLVNEEQRQRFYAHVEQLFFLFKVGKDSFAYLNSAHILFGNVACDLVCADNLAVGESHRAAHGVDILHGVALVLLHFLRDEIEIVVYADKPCFAVDRLIVAYLKLNARHRRLFRGDDNAFKEQIAVRAAEILHLKALDLDFLYKPLVVSVQRVKHIHKIMLLCVGRGVIQTEQRVEVFQRFLRDLAAHFLRLVKNDNRAVCLDNINRSA